MKNANYKLNQELNGIEIIFTEKPEADVIQALKIAGFRWHNVKKLWYAKQTAERIALAAQITDGKTETTPKAETKPEEINLENLGVKPANFSYYGAGLAKIIREELKRRGVKGVTVRANRGGWTTSLTITIQATENDFASIEEAKERFTISDFVLTLDRSQYINGRYYSLADYYEMDEAGQNQLYTDYIVNCIRRLETVNHYHADRRNYWELTTKFFNKVKAIIAITEQFNYDNSDIMTDYHDKGYYTNYDLKKGDFQPRENMTDSEKIALQEEREAKEREQAEAIRKYEEERKAAEEAAAKYNAWKEEATAKINANIQVETLEKPLYITNIVGGIGKEATHAELLRTIEENERTPQDAEITRKVIFTDSEALEDFKKLYLEDFDFINGGGTSSEDFRLDDLNTLYKLTEAQRETIKFYNGDCIGVYYENALQMVINPQGYNYCRYVFIPTENTSIIDATEEKERQAAESREKPAFYIPAPVEEQAAAISEGDVITIYQTDGWILNNIYCAAGTVTAKYCGNYAQYNNGIYLEIANGKKTKRVFLRNGKETLIYKGIKGTLPEEVTARRINDRMSELLNYEELFENAYKYYLEKGEKPILDTVAK